jgi:lysophospholipase L1-like esterase
MTRRRRLGRRLLGLLLLVLLIELALQAASPIVRRAMARRDGPLPPGASLSVLCVGDSNTYGLHVPRAFSYPEQLRGRLEARLGRPVAVHNRGVPGQNSAQVARELEQDLLDTRPDLVLVLVGLNDTWNLDAEQASLRNLLGELKLVRLTRILLAGVTTAGRFDVATDEQGEFVVDRGAGVRRVNPGLTASGGRSGAALASSVRAGLTRIVRLCGEHGAQPVLMTYPEFQGEHGTVNEATRATAAELEVLLVDHERDFGGHFAREGYPTLMLNDHHPNVRGYGLMAEAVERALVDTGWLPEAAGPAPSPETPLPGPAGLEALPAGRLRLSGPPGWPFQLLVARSPAQGQGFRVGATWIPLPEDEILDLSRLEPSFSGRLDADGESEVVIPHGLSEAAAGAPLSACLILIDVSGTGEPVASLAGPVALQP